MPRKINTKPKVIVDVRRIDMPLEGGVYGRQDSLPITNFHSLRYRTKAVADLRLSPAESTLVPASVVDYSGCSEGDEDAAFAC